LIRKSPLKEILLMKGIKKVPNRFWRGNPQPQLLQSFIPSQQVILSRFSVFFSRGSFMIFSPK
jgi:hypothetical protein